MSMIPAWLTAAAKAVDKVTRVPLEYLRRRAIRNAAREKLRKHEKDDDDEDDND